MDGNGNASPIISAGVGTGTASASVAATLSITNASEIKKLAGESMQAGGSIAVGTYSAGAEYVAFTDNETGAPLSGVNINVGRGIAKAGLLGEIPAELHVVFTESRLLGEPIDLFNLQDLVHKKIDEALDAG